MKFFIVIHAAKGCINHFDPNISAYHCTYI